MRVFRKLTPASDWSHIQVSKRSSEDKYTLDIYNHDKLVSTIYVATPLSNMIRELEAMGCNISAYRHTLPVTHQDIGDSTLKGV